MLVWNHVYLYKNMYNVPLHHGLQAFFPCFPECFFFLPILHFQTPLYHGQQFFHEICPEPPRLSKRPWGLWWSGWSWSAAGWSDEASSLSVEGFLIWKYIKLTKARHFFWEKFIHILEISFFWVAWVIVTVCVFFFFSAPFFFYFIWWFLKLKTPTKDIRANATNITLGHDVTSCRSSGHVFFRGIFARRPSCLSPVFGKFGVGSSKSEMPTLPGTNSSPVKIDGWNTSFLLGWPIFEGKLFALGRVIHRFFRSIPKLVLHGNGHLRIPHWELRRRCSASWPSDGWMARSFRNPSRCRRFGLVHHKWSQSAQVFAGLQYNSLTNWSMDSGVWIRHLQPKTKLVLMLANFWCGELRTSIFNHFYLVLFCLKWMIFPQMFFEMSDFPLCSRHHLHPCRTFWSSGA